MNDIGGAFDRLFIGIGLGAVAALILTPLMWRLAAGLLRFRRLAFAALGALGLVGLAVAVVAFEYRDPEMPAFTMVSALIVQAVVLPVILLLSRKGA